MRLQVSQYIVGRESREPDIRVAGVAVLSFRAVHRDRPYKSLQAGNEPVSLAAQLLAPVFGGRVGKHVCGYAYADAKRDGHSARAQAVLLAATVDRSAARSGLEVPV